MYLLLKKHTVLGREQIIDNNFTEDTEGKNYLNNFYEENVSLKLEIIKTTENNTFIEDIERKYIFKLFS